MALSKPWPDGGKPPKSAQSEPGGTVPSNHGANAGLSVLTVNLPGVFVLRFAAWHSGAIDPAAIGEPDAATGDPDGAPGELDAAAGEPDAGAADGEAGASDPGPDGGAADPAAGEAEDAAG